MNYDLDKFSGVFDVSIIGAGVAGLYSAYSCGISGLNCALVDSMMCSGGQCAMLYPEKKIYGVPGFEAIKAKDFIHKLSSQCLTFPEKLFFGHKVENISKDTNGVFILKTSKNLEIRSKNLIIATGIGEMTPSVPNSIEGINNIKKDSDFVQYYCMKIDIYKGKNVIIAGGGDSAIDFATNLANVAKNITIIHRRSNFTCEENKLKILKDLPNIEIKLEQQILKIRDNLVITNIESLKADHIIFCYGFLAETGFIKVLSEFGLEIENNLIKIDINTMETSIENCYAAGDIVSYQNKKKNIVPCFFEADRAVRMIKNKMSQHNCNL